MNYSFPVKLFPLSAPAAINGAFVVAVLIGIALFVIAQGRKNTSVRR